MYMVPTKRGVGVQLWGTHDDLEYFYNTITVFFLGDDKPNVPGAENRLKLLSSFSYEVKKAYEGARLKRSYGHFSLGDQPYLGVEISWVHFLFSLAGLKYAMNYQCMRFINVEFIQLGGGKRAFRRLPELLKMGVVGNDAYYEYKDVLTKEAKRLKSTLAFGVDWYKVTVLNAL